MIWCGKLLGKNNGTKDMMWVVCCVLVGFCLILHERNTGLVASKSRTSRPTSHICLFLSTLSTLSSDCMERLMSFFFLLFILFFLSIILILVSNQLNC